MDNRSDSSVPTRASKRRLLALGADDNTENYSANPERSDDSDSDVPHDSDVEMVDEPTSGQRTSAGKARSKRNYKKSKNFQIPDSSYQSNEILNLCPPGFKVDVTKAFSQSKLATTACVNYNIRVIIAIRRKLTPVDKELILVSTFGFPKSQIKTAGEAKAADTKASGKLDVIIVKAFKNASD